MKTRLYPHEKSLTSIGRINIAAGLVTADGLNKLMPKTDGFLVMMPEWMKVEFNLAIQVPRDINAQVISVYGRKRNISIKRTDYSPNKPAAVFAKPIRTRPTKMFNEHDMVIYSTKHEGNNLRIIIVENNLFQMWEVAIPTRIINEEAHYFLTIQKLYEAKMFNLSNEIYISDFDYPGYKDWLDLQLLLHSMVDPMTLPTLDKTSLEQKKRSDTGSLSHNEAEIIFFCLASGIGIARTNQGMALLHWRELVSSDRFSFVSSGQKVVYESIVQSGDYLKLKNIYPL